MKAPENYPWTDRKPDCPPLNYDRTACIADGSREKLIETWDDVRHAFEDIHKRPSYRYEWHQRIARRVVLGTRLERK
jgi:hypothetical protein